MSSLWSRVPRVGFFNPQAFRSRSFFRMQRRPAHSKPSDPNSRFDRVNARLPRFIRRYTEPLRHQTLTIISSFLLLHELTAIVPLFGLTAGFHYYQWLPPFISEGKIFSDTMTKMGNYFRRKGWIGSDVDVEEETEIAKGKKRGALGKWWSRGESGTLLLVEAATAYAIVKTLLPVRLVFSVWAAPWFARVAVVPFVNMFKRMFGRAPKSMTAVGSSAPNASAKASPVAGTNAVGGGVVSKRKP